MDWILYDIDLCHERVKALSEYESIPQKTEIKRTVLILDKLKDKVKICMRKIGDIERFQEISPFHVTPPFLCPLKRPEIYMFSDVFRKHRKRPVTLNGLKGGTVSLFTRN